MVGVRRFPARPIDPENLPTIEEWVALKDPFRVVSHGLPIPYFKEKGTDNAKLLEIYELSIKPKVLPILTQHGITSTCYSVRTFLKFPGLEIFVVETDGTDMAKWSATASALLEVFVASGALEVAEEMQVEIRNPHKFYCDIGLIVPPDPPLVKALEDVSKAVSDAVQTALGGVWSSIGYRMKVSFRGDGPPKPTVTVSCRYQSIARFDLAEEQIMQALDTVPTEIHLELSPGQVCNADTRGMPW